MKAYLLILCATSFAGAQVYGAKPCDSSVQYENHNMIDYGVKVRKVKGSVIDLYKAPLAKSCIAVFNPDHSKLVRTLESDADGKFDVEGISPGKYWLVVKDLQRAFCPMAAKLEVGRWRGKRSLIVQMRPAGIDTCSFCEAR